MLAGSPQVRHEGAGCVPGESHGAAPADGQGWQASPRPGGAQEAAAAACQDPCQQELDQVLERISTMRLPDERGPLEHLYSLHIPNCDKHGLYNLKQCKMSLNGQRGECWCVNPNTGKLIQGAPTIRGTPSVISSTTSSRGLAGHTPSGCSKPQPAGAWHPPPTPLQTQAERGECLRGGWGRIFQEF